MLVVTPSAGAGPDRPIPTRLSQPHVPLVGLTMPTRGGISVGVLPCEPFARPSPLVSSPHGLRVTSQRGRPLHCAVAQPPAAQRLRSGNVSEAVAPLWRQRLCGGSASQVSGAGRLVARLPPCGTATAAGGGPAALPPAAEPWSSRREREIASTPRRGPIWSPVSSSSLLLLLHGAGHAGDRVTGRPSCAVPPLDRACVPHGLPRPPSPPTAAPPPPLPPLSPCSLSAEPPHPLRQRPLLYNPLPSSVTPWPPRLPWCGPPPPFSPPPPWARSCPACRRRRTGRGRQLVAVG